MSSQLGLLCRGKRDFESEFSAFCSREIKQHVLVILGIFPTTQTACKAANFRIPNKPSINQKRTEVFDFNHSKTVREISKQNLGSSTDA